MKKHQKKIRAAYKKCRKFFHRYINGTKGVISLFLAILMVPFTGIAGALVSAARINSAIAIFDEALCNASNSTLGTYDEFLRKRFHLLAVSQDSQEGASQFISETFSFYMEQNLGTLSNTYTNEEYSATGIYPLADTDILLSQVLEASKYTIPTQLVVDGLSLDDLLNSLTKSFSLGKNILDTLTAGIGMADKCMDVDTKFETLQTKVEEAETAKGDCDDAYTTLKNSVKEYNDLIDEIKSKIQEKQIAVNNAQTKVDQCQSTLDNEAEKISDILKEIEKMEKEKDANGKKVDNTEKIKQFKEEHKAEMEAYNAAAEALSTAKSELSSAKTALDNVVSSYANSLSQKRTAVINARDTYAQKINSYASKLKSAGEAAIAAQNSIKDAASQGAGLAVSIVKTGHSAKTEKLNNNVEDLKKKKQEALDKSDAKAAEDFQKQIDEADKEKSQMGNVDNIAGAVESGVKEGINSVKSFETQNFTRIYDNAYHQLLDLKSRVEAYTVHNDSNTKLAGVSSYKVTISNTLTSANVEELRKDLGEEIANSSFVATLKAIKGFIDAMLNISTWADSNLCAKIETSNYTQIGGLPSQKDRSENSPYSLASPFADVDQQKSDYYKTLLGEYTDNPLLNGSASEGESIISVIKNNLAKLTGLEWKWNTILKDLYTAIKAIGDIVKAIINLLNNIIDIIKNAVQEKILLTGYVAYNTANRTTYTGKALTGASYSLPNKGSDHQGYAFYGAETEYIICGKLSEKDNQQKIFNITYIFRLLYNIAIVATNSEIASIASAAGAVSFGVGTYIIYALYVIAEPFVDTVILVNAGSIPMIKTKAYLVPSGIPDLITKFLSISLSEAMKSTIYSEVSNITSKGSGGADLPKDYASAKEAAKNDKLPSKVPDNKFTQSWDLDYTKSLLLLMTFFTSTDTMISRLADIIQMEASYSAVNKIGSYTFNLDNSYTYLRASGSFEATEFIKISEMSKFNSKERVLYRGY